MVSLSVVGISHLIIFLMCVGMASLRKQKLPAILASSIYLT